MDADRFERLSSYIDSLYAGNTPLLDTLEAEARKAGVPVIQSQVQSLLKTLLELKKPARILEVGCATGFSAIFMCTYSPGSDLVTIENYEKRIPVARRNFARAGMGDRITLLEGDAADILHGLACGRVTDGFDFVFMDAAKGQYINFLPDVKRLLSPGGVLLSDNVLQGGGVIESRFAVERRDRTIHSRMRGYLYALTHDDDLVTSVIDAADGVAFSVRRDGPL